ncbi:TPA: hypothetical protein SMU04_003998, partial [Proteus mirabilis]|nr:hypothetical protein [Proteus mirabilis]
CTDDIRNHAGHNVAHPRLSGRRKQEYADEQFVPAGNAVPVKAKYQPAGNGHNAPLPGLTDKYLGAAAEHNRR